MSLVVSLRVPDGIVVAADSLSTARNLLEVAAQSGQIKCPKCGSLTAGADLKLPPIAIPFSASSFTQKIFPLRKEFAVAAFGQGIVNNRSIYYHVMQFEQSIQEDEELTLVDLRDRFIPYMEEQLLQQYPKYRQEAPRDWHPLGFHINGYQSGKEGTSVGVTYTVYIGRENIMRKRDQLGCTIGGDMKVVQKLWEIGKDDPRRKFKYQLFSLQDAIDLSTFLINTTSTFQRFANEVPTVGGEVDVALVTPFHGFQWIRRKALMATLGEAR